MTFTRTLSLPDGRQLAYDELGDSAGPPLLFFHGVPGSRHHARFIRPDDRQDSAWLRILAPDRPGVGLSTPHAGRSIRSFAEDAAVLADALSLREVVLAAFSGGTAYALATARLLGDRASQVVLISPIADLSVPRLRAGLDPVVRRGLTFAQTGALTHVPGLERLSAAAFVRRGADAARHLLPAADRRLLGDSKTRPLVDEALAESVRQGTHVALDELRLLAAPWEFELADVRAPVTVLVGSADPWSTDEMAHWFEVGLPQCRVKRYDGDGHFTVLAHHASRELQPLLSSATCEVAV